MLVKGASNNVVCIPLAPLLSNRISRCEIVGRRVIFIWSLIHGSSWSGLIKVGPGVTRVKRPWKAWANDAFKSCVIGFYSHTTAKHSTPAWMHVMWFYIHGVRFSRIFLIIRFLISMHYLRFQIAKWRGYTDELIISIWSLRKTDIVGHLRNLCGAVYCISWCTNQRDGRVCVNFVTLCMSSWPQEYTRKVSNIRRTKCQNLNDSRLVLQLSMPNPLKPSVKSIMKM